MSGKAEVYEMPSHVRAYPGFDPFEPISPVDPFSFAPSAGTTTAARQTQATELFKAVYLDLQIDLDGKTQPLRVRKQGTLTARIAGIGPSSTSSFSSDAKLRYFPGRRRRGSTVTLPRSPCSPGTPTSSHLRPSRTDTSSTTASSVHPRYSISHIFLSLPDDITSPPPRPTPSRMYRSHSGNSELHLGLGRFAAYDESAKPGPSPPASPAASPTRRDFTFTVQTRPNRAKVPPSPRTPSRASEKGKAPKLLGASKSTSSQRTPKRTEHFRPLPSQTLVEIERFFGEDLEQKVWVVKGDQWEPGLRALEDGKLAPRARPCCFLGYSNTQKDYKLWDPIERTVVISRDVTFDETISPSRLERPATPLSDLKSKLPSIERINCLYR